MQIFNNMNEIKFNPWIGKNYENSKRILIIGDSHYWPYFDEEINYDINFTKYIISDEKSLNANFFNNTAKLFGYNKFSELRDNIAFCNAIQDFMISSTQKPSTEQLKQTEFSIISYIKLTRPHKVIILSFRIWEYLFNKKKNWGNYKCDIKSLSKKTTIWELYPMENFSCLAIGMYHPSAINWKLEDWEPILNQFLNEK